MSLQDKLVEYKAQFESSLPPKALAIMHRATDDLRHSGIMERVLKIGDPGVCASQCAGADSQLSKAAGKGFSSGQLLSRYLVTLLQSGAGRSGRSCRGD